LRAIRSVTIVLADIAAGPRRASSAVPSVIYTGQVSIIATLASGDEFILC